MYKVTKRDCPMFGIGPYVCEFICDTASDISTLPTSISEGTGGKTVHDNQKCASGSMAIVADNGAESKQYMLNNQDIWCPYSVASGSSEHQDLSEYAKKTEVPSIKVNSAVNADTVNGHTVNADVPADAKFTDTVPDLTPYALKSKYGDTTIDVGRKANTSIGSYSTAEGCNTIASGYCSHTEGTETTASSAYSHAEGSHTTASGDCSHAEGIGTTASRYSSHAEGDSTTASGNCSHAEGCETTADSDSSHAEGNSTTASGDSSHAEGFYATARGYYSHAEGSGTTASGYASHAEGTTTTASGDYSHAEGSNLNSSGSAMSDRTITISDVNYTIAGSTAYGINSHAEGAQSFAYGYSSHVEGYRATASGYDSHAEGGNTTASGSCSHAEGSTTTASGDYSHAEGRETTASNYASHAGGKYNASMTTGGSYSNTIGTAFVVGNGTSKTALSNAFSVMFDGTVKAKSTITASTTADYAEFFEWLDGNPNEEDRVGYFVTMDGDKIKIANSDDGYILGVVSGEPFVLGNGDCDTWNGMFLRDEFRRTVYEPAPKMEEILDDEGNPTGEFEEIEGEFEGTRPKLNPKYDHTQTYISRFDRPEWAPVGMLGVLAIRHDGTAKVNGYVTVADGGIATACDKNAENSYRVIKSNSDSVVEIIFR